MPPALKHLIKFPTKMSYALATKKRKFHRVLDSISGANAQKPPNADAATKDNAPTAASQTQVKHPTIKKVRLASSNYTTEQDDMIVRPSVSNISRQSSLSPSSSHRPNFVPWDRERFLERLETFRRVDRWSPKPAPVNEVQWAKRGWSCVDVMRVECVGGCGRAVVVKLPEEDDVDEDDTDKIIERREVHTIQRLPLTNPETALKGLHTRYLNLARLGSKLPPIENIEKPDDLDMDEALKLLPPTFASDESGHETGEQDSNASEQAVDKQDNQEKNEDINWAAFTLAICGWDAYRDAGADLATCGACFRRLGLWMYKPKEDGSISVYEKLNVVGEHMDYCPWVNAKTQSGGRKPIVQGPNGKPQSGWETVCQAIKTMHRRRTRSDVPPSSTSAEPASQEAPPSPAEATIEDDESRKVRDREWWAKLRRVRHSLQVKGPKKANK
ncbi:hypothetical protein AJ79_03750 [Helicocarpus griseus UAMH5409]|uniref:C3HC-type domain-containing protein n=1 Tax=Helicocarpus griseus UAMH5409 TaxID=1447875 RepID=A0A2B7XX18_9EURO|nr:hypothetical protein AJ79_03750 [Helicocarpus griseus UAMH5409]